MARMDGDTRQAGTSLLLDIGSTSVKAALMSNADGTLVAEVREPMPAELPTVDTRHEVDPVQVASVVAVVVESLLEGQDIAPTGAIMSTQMHTCLLTDADNTPLSPLITWQDNRLLERSVSGRTHLEDLVAAAGESVWLSSGLAQRPGLGAANLGLWLRENPGARRAGTRIQTLGSYLSTSLGGPYATGISNAAALGLLDLRHGEWSPDLLALHGLGDCELPTVLPVPEVAGALEGRGIPWFGDVGDHQAAVFGSGGLSSDELEVSLGTAGIAARVADEPSVDPRVDTRPYFDGRYLLALSRRPGGALATEFAEVLVDIASHFSGEAVSTTQVWERLADIAPQPEMVASLDVSEAVNGQRRLSFLDVSPDGAVQEVYSAFVDHYVDSYRECVSVLFPKVDQQPRRLKFNGGFAALSGRLRGTLAERLGLDSTDIPPGDRALHGLGALIRSGLTGREST